MDDTTMPPQQGQRARSRIPPEIIEEIMLKLPVKSPVRFSTASKTWHSMIFGPKFARKHKDRAALLHRHRIVINAGQGAIVSSSNLPIKTVIDSVKGCATARFCTISPKQPTAVALDPFGFFDCDPRVVAVCDELWCVDVRMSLYLWNPCMRSYKKLPSPLFAGQESIALHNLLTGISFPADLEFIYGLTYDSAADDYKILKIGKRCERADDYKILKIGKRCERAREKCELYSLKNNCWRSVESYPSIPILFQNRCEFLHGNFHWIGCSSESTPMTIVAFDLSQEKCGTLALPEPKHSDLFNELKTVAVVVMRGMLCVCMSDFVESKFWIWEMGDYAVEESCTKKFDVHFGSRFDKPYRPIFLRPLYFHDSDDIPVTAQDTHKSLFEIVLLKNEEETVSCVAHWFPRFDAFLYVESLISPDC